MGKHRNLDQEKLFMESMKCHQDIARGDVKGNRAAVDAFWIELTEKLNSCGPPRKDCYAWKKTWTDWKTYVKKKMSQNKIGSGSYNKYALSELEEDLARICGIDKSMEAFQIVFVSESEGEMDEELDLSSSSSTNSRLNGNDISRQTNVTPSAKRRLSRSPSPSSTQKRCRSRSPHVSNMELSRLLEEKNKHLDHIAKLLEEKRDDNILENILHVMEEQRDEMRQQNQKLERLCNIMEKQYKTRQLNDILSSTSVLKQYFLD